mgnify:FL=1
MRALLINRPVKFIGEPSDYKLDIDNVIEGYNTLEEEYHAKLLMQGIEPAEIERKVKIPNEVAEVFFKEEPVGIYDGTIYKYNDFYIVETKEGREVFVDIDSKLLRQNYQDFQRTNIKYLIYIPNEDTIYEY